MAVICEIGMMFNYHVHQNYPTYHSSDNGVKNGGKAQKSVKNSSIFLTCSLNFIYVFDFF